MQALSQLSYGPSVFDSGSGQNINLLTGGFKRIPAIPPLKLEI